MRTAIAHGQKALTKIENRDFLTAQLNGAAFAQRNVFGLRDADPVHTFTVSMGWIWTNCVACLG